MSFHAVETFPQPSSSRQAAKLELKRQTPLTGRQGGHAGVGHGLSPGGPVNGRRMARRRETDGGLGDAGQHSASSPHPGVLAARVRPCRRVCLPDETREENGALPPPVRGRRIKGLALPVAASPSSLLSLITPIVDFDSANSHPTVVATSHRSSCLPPASTSTPRRPSQPQPSRGSTRCSGASPPSAHALSPAACRA